jgi:predicted DNA-binding transcriptional regulator YafY
MNRLDRLTAILIQLQSKRVVRAQEIAERFGISLRTVYRDVRSLENSGVPIIGEAGVGYSLADGYRLPPVQFTRDEAASFLAAEKLVENFTDAGIDQQYKSAMLKVRAVLRGSDKDFLEKIDAAIQVVSGHGRKVGNNATALLPVLIQSISDHEILSLQYNSAAGIAPENRTIEPIGVFYRDDKWYLLAWCQLRKALRHFRLDRMAQLRRTSRFFEAHTLDLQTHLNNDTPQFPCIIGVENDTLSYIDGQKQYFGFIKEITKGDYTEMYFETRSYTYLARWMLQFSDKIRSIAPKELEQTLLDILHQAMTKLS